MIEEEEYRRIGNVNAVVSQSYRLCTHTHTSIYAISTTLRKIGKKKKRRRKTSNFVDQTFCFQFTLVEWNNYWRMDGIDETTIVDLITIDKGARREREGWNICINRQRGISIMILEGTRMFLSRAPSLGILLCVHALFSSPPPPPSIKKVQVRGHKSRPTHSSRSYYIAACCSWFL